MRTKRWKNFDKKQDIIDDNCVNVLHDNGGR